MNIFVYVQNSSRRHPVVLTEEQLTNATATPVHQIEGLVGPFESLDGLAQTFPSLEMF